MSNPTPGQPPRGEVFYDADCAICSRGAVRWGGLFARHGFAWLPLQTPGTPARTGASGDELRAEMKLRFADGRVIGGAEAWAVLFRSVWWLWPLGVLIDLPGVKVLSATAYRWIARNRYCISGACELARRQSLVTWLPLIVLPATAWLLRDAMPAWGFFWAMACAIYAACKWLTFREAVGSTAKPSTLRATGYLLAWVGMDAKPFLKPQAADPGAPGEWLGATAKTACGAALIWLVARRVLTAGGALAGWTGMVGVIFLLHFGSFHLLSLAWRAAGVNAAPLMRKPLRSVSLTEFWGRRWNTAFHELVHRFTFRPLARRVGATGATLLGFFLSGLAHECVISLPARGGYGLPTGYFVLQGLAVATEHTRVGRRIGLGRGWRGWLFTMTLAAAPAGLLFHPPFIHHVILPMLHALGAT